MRHDPISYVPGHTPSVSPWTSDFLYQDVEWSFEMDQALSEHVQAPEALVIVAFDMAWRFVEKDPFLAHNLKTVLHSRLRAFLECSIRNGERNTLHLANEAIRNLRAELAPSPAGEDRLRYGSSRSFAAGKQPG